jgi:steroid 5-alpha reductase family enzyme
MNVLHLVIFAAMMGAALFAVVAVAWQVQLTTGNTGWIDVFWTFGLGAVAIIASLVPISDGPWPHARQIMVAILVAVWSLRLGWHILMRTRTVGDDPRYRQLITQWGTDAARQMFWQLQKQAAVSLVLAISIVLAAQNPHPGLRTQDVLGLATLIAAIVGETVSDYQLRQFKADPANRNSVCNVGLWRWSRHPNYFFEWLCWLAYPLIAIDLAGYNPYGWLALLAPACMYWVLVYVSGIPPLEEHMLRSRGETFRAYQRRTRAFFPLPVISPK